MSKRFSSIPLLLFLHSLLLLQAQPNNYGVPMITNYPYHETGGSEQNYCLTQDHRGVLYVGNYEKGILEYDGVAWRNITMPNNVPVLSMVTGDDGVVYVGAEGDMGLLEPDSRGLLHFRSLLDSTLMLETPDFSVWKTYFNNGKVWFCSHTGILVYHPKTGELESLATPEDAYHSYMVMGRLYISDYAHGLMILEGDHFIKVAGGDFFHEKSITGLDLLETNNLLISTYENGIYILNTVTGQIEDNFLDEVLMDEFRSGIITFTKLRDQDLLVCTYFNGLYILDLEGRVKEIISETEGLIDNTIIQVYTENNQSGSGPIWIANWKGVSKVESNNPFRVFTESSGFENLITDIIRFKGTLYVSTMNGLFYKGVEGDQTVFIKVPEIGINVHDLQLISPSRWREFLLVSTDREVYVINERKHVSRLSESLVVEDGIPVNRDQIGGRFILNDPDRGDIIYTGDTRVVELQYYRGRWKQNSVSPMLKDEIYHMAKDRYGYLWVSTATKVIRIDLELAPAITVKTFSAAHGLPLDENTKVFLNPLSKNLMVGTYDGFYYFNYFQERFLPDSLFNSVLPQGRNTIRTFYQDTDGDYWYSFENERSGWSEMLLRQQDDQIEVLSDKPFLRLPSAASADLFYSDKESGIWFSKSDELYHFDKSFSKQDRLPFQTLIRRVIIGGDSVLFYGTNYKPLGKEKYTIHTEQVDGARPYINFEYNNIGFQWAAPYFEQEDQIRYSYFLEGFSRTWSDWQKVPFVEFINLKYGKYTLELKAKNVYDIESLPCSYSFIISRPWYATFLAIISYFLLGILLVYLLVRLYTFRLKKENIRLEGIIDERTAKIRQQKEELTDSIEYASRIQHALLPSVQLLEEKEIEHFILFRPRDIVSGDFYWIGEKNDRIVIVAADCTGHGVPGAFMSMLGMTFLEEIVIKSGITRTDEIMEALRERVIHSMEQSGTGKYDTIMDGMDLAMICLDMKNNRFQYSGAYNPLYMVRKLKRGEKSRIKNGEDLELPRGSVYDDQHVLIQVRADQMPIGISEKQSRFIATSINDERYNLYMFSDGFLDQFGGPRGKKYMSKNFKKLLLDLQVLPLKEQGEALEKELLSWMGNIEQIDDILVMGLRIM